MYRLGENSITSFTQAGSGAVAIESGAMQSVEPGQDYDAPPPEAVGPNGEPCPCPPPTIIYRDRWHTKFVDKPYPVPGPTVYVDRYLPVEPSPAYGGEVEVYDKSGIIVQIPAASGETEIPEDSEMTEGGEVPTIRAVSKFPWWLLVVGGGALYLFGRKKKSKA